MEDAATAEISRSQIWQWVHGGVALDDRRDRHRRAGARAGRPTQASSSGAARPTTPGELFEQVALADDFVDFLTLPAYELID